MKQSVTSSLPLTFRAVGPSVSEDRGVRLMLWDDSTQTDFAIDSECVLTT